VILPDWVADLADECVNPRNQQVPIPVCRQPRRSFGPRIWSYELTKPEKTQPDLNDGNVPGAVLPGGRERRADRGFRVDTGNPTSGRS
jgi:hypothetical protein